MTATRNRPEALQMQCPIESRFLCFLEKELSLPAGAIALAINHHHEDLSSEDLSLLPITLWQHELVMINQVGSIQVDLCSTG